MIKANIFSICILAREDYVLVYKNKRELIILFEMLMTIAVSQYIGTTY